MKKIGWFVFMCLGFLSCSNRERDVLATFDNVVPLESLPSNDIHIDSLVKPDFFCVLEDKVVVVQNDMPQMIMVYDMAKDSCHMLLDKGNAEDEALNVSFIGVMDDEKGFYVYDNFKSKIFFFYLIEDKFILSKIVDESDCHTFFFKDGATIGCSNNNNGRYLIKNNGQKKYFEDYSNVKGIPAEFANGLLQGFVVKHPKEQLFAWFSFYSEMFNIVDHAKEGKIIVDKQYSIPQVEVQEYPVFLPTTKLGFVSLAANEKSIYSLYNGKTIQESASLGSDVLLANDILVYDWSGEPVVRYTSKDKIKTISIDNINKRLYYILSDVNGGYILKYINIV